MARPQHRKDIQGLRTLAVLLVVAGHLFPAVVTGGFIGVDIFFVISGFIITQQMLTSDLNSKGSFLVNFYARRVRRILPSALLVTAVTIWATGRFLGPVAANEASLAGGWATVFLSNFHFHNTTLDYFAAGTQVSPLQHFWSLSIEEQFYLVWPTIFILLFLKSTSLKFRQGFLLVVISLSLFTAVYQTLINQTPIFFSTWTRIWELAAGAMVAISARFIQLPRFATIGSVAALILAGFLLPQSMQWPGLTTIPVILATVLLLLRNPRISHLTFLENKAATYMGDLSYIIYLWHWPVLVITQGHFGRLGTQEICLVVALTALLSVATHHLYENPIRYSNQLSTNPLLTVSFGAISIAAMATILFTRYQG
jgi:peptidoglycan/LPS O-acetylase OafA/YrhL